MYLIDTSVWIDVFRDSSRARSRQLERRIAEGMPLLCRFTQLELLQGARNQVEWEVLDEYLSGQQYLEMKETTWQQAARLYFGLRRAGKTVRSAIDCCIAQLAIENEAVLLHRDGDFVTLSEQSPLQEEFLDWGP